MLIVDAHPTRAKDISDTSRPIKSIYLSESQSGKLDHSIHTPVNLWPLILIKRVIT